MNKIGMYIKKIHLKLEHGRNMVTKDFGLTGPQLEVLKYLATCDDNKNTLSDLAKSFEVKHTSMIHITKILEERGFIYKEAARPGYRSKPIFLTDKGNALINHCKESIQKVDKIVLAGFSEEEIVQLEELLCRLYNNLDQASEEYTRTH